MRRAASRVALALLLLGTAAASQEKYHARLLTAAELRQAESQLAALVGNSQAEYDAQQSFLLEASGQPALLLAAVKYPAPHNAYDCALGFVPKGAPPYLLATIGTGEREAVSCTALSGLGFLANAARPMPDIALVYDSHSPNFPVSTPLLLRWDAHAGRYAIDEAVSRKLGDLEGTETIAGIRKALGAASR